MPTERSKGQTRGIPPVPPEFLALIRRPKTDRYRKLLVAMLRANQAAEAGQDELYVVMYCVVSLMHFLDADPLVESNVLTRPLATLAKSLRDLGQGAKPRLFYARRKGGPGRPKDISFEVVRGTVAAIVAKLIEWGETRDTAGKLVADHLQKLHVLSASGKAIQARQVLRWRDEMGGSTAELAESAYKDGIARYSEVPVEITADTRERRRFARNALTATWSMGF